MPTTTKKTKTASAATNTEAPTSASKSAETKVPQSEVYRIKAQEMVEKVKEIINEGNVRQIIIEDKDGKILFTVPVTFGILGAVIVPWVAGLGLVVAVVGECTIRVEKQ
jgi:uncharacterized membrane protein